MDQKFIEVESYWEIMIKNEYIMQDSETLVVLLPGNRYTHMAPILYYSYNIALQLGFDVLAIDYGFQKTEKDFLYEQKNHVISESKEAMMKALNTK